ncbi:MAG: hypothetical protein RIC84_10500, partial [Aggregatilineales bacterium]
MRFCMKLLVVALLFGTVGLATAQDDMTGMGDGYTIAGVVFQNDTFMQTVQAGMEAAAEVSGAELILGNSENDLVTEADLIEDYITRGVDAI